MLAKTSLSLSRWREDVPTDWIVTSVTHSVGSDGWRMDVEAELSDRRENAEWLGTFLKDQIEKRSERM